jgi:hypothetical protein
MTVEMVWRSGVLFRTGVVMMEAIEITTLHLWGPGYPKLPSGTGCGVILVGGLRKGRAQRGRPIVGHSYDHGTRVLLLRERLRWPR